MNPAPQQPRGREPAPGGGVDDSSPLHLQTYLDAIGLPWRDTYASLAIRYRMEPGRLPGTGTMAIDTARAFVRGLVHPLQVDAGAHRLPDVPAIEFRSSVSYGLGASDNLRQAVLLLQPVLGAGIALAQARRHIWRFGLAFVTLSQADDPPRGASRSQTGEVERGQQAACQLFISTCWRRALSAGDRIALAGFTPITLLGEAGHEVAPPDHPPSIHEWDYIREPEPGDARFHRWLGWSSDRSLLIFRTTQLYLIPIADVIQLNVTRILPARGGGGAYLHLVCSASGGRRRWIELATGAAADDLNALAASIAQAIDRPFALLPYEQDA